VSDTTETRRKAWATRRDKYGQNGHSDTAYGVPPRPLDERDLYALEAAIDALEALHDGDNLLHGGEHVRQCLCAQASAWRGARKVTVAWRELLGLKVRLLDRV